MLSGDSRRRLATFLKSFRIIQQIALHHIDWSPIRKRKFNPLEKSWGFFFIVFETFLNSMRIIPQITIFVQKERLLVSRTFRLVQRNVSTCVQDEKFVIQWVSNMYSRQKRSSPVVSRYGGFFFFEMGKFFSKFVAYLQIKSEI